MIIKIKKTIQFALLMALVAGAAISFLVAISYAGGSRKNLLYFREILELLVFVSGLMMLLRYGIPLTLMRLWLVILIYVIGSLSYVAALMPSHLLDALLIYKSFIYLLLIAFFINKRIFELETLSNAFQILLVTYLIGYATQILIGLTSRPYLLLENNFEILLLGLVLYGLYAKTKHISFLNIFLLGMIVFMSGSRFAVVGYAFIMIMMLSSQWRSRKAFLLSLVGVMAFIMAFELILERMPDSGIEGIDRYQFFEVFLEEVHDWGFLDFLFGAERVSPLSAFACHQLIYYNFLFSLAGDGSCYSVVLHSFLLRTLYDHGFLGLMLIVSFSVRMLSLAGYQWRDIASIIGVMLLNGLSVSSFNTVFFAIGFIILVSMYQEKEINKGPFTGLSRWKIFKPKLKAKTIV